MGIDATIDALRAAAWSLRGERAPAPELAVIDALGRSLTGEVSTAAIADALVTALPGAAAAHGVALSCGAVLVRAGGARHGRRLTRWLVDRGEPLGALSLWVARAEAGHAEAVLDAVVPWLTTALAAARLRNDRDAAQQRAARARAARDERERAFRRAVARYSEPVYAIDARGHVEPWNPAAKAALARDHEAALQAIARAAGEQTEVLAVPLSDGVRHLVVPRRQSLPAIGRRAAEKWGLSRRQSEVLFCALRGMRGREIAAALRCSEVTIEKHLGAIYRKARVRDRQALVLRALGCGR